MKLKEILYLFGLWRPQSKTYGFRVTETDLPAYGKIRFAQWLHPKQRVVVIEQDSIDELKRYLQDGDVALDIGAHTGDTTVPMAMACGRSGMVFALEPNSYVFPVLAENARLNADYGTIVPLNFAASENDGKLVFEYSDEGFCNGGLHKGIGVLQHGHVFKLEVEGRNLITFLNSSYSEAMKRIRFIKTDCEGYDLFVIKSLLPLISENKPYLKIEVHKNTTRDYREELFCLLADQGYDIFLHTSDSQLKGGQLDLNGMHASKHFDIFCIHKS
jgi:FkbM family methyltransferase